MVNLWIFVTISCLLIGSILGQTMSFEEAEKAPNCVCDGNYCRCVRYRYKYSNATEGSSKMNDQQKLHKTSTTRTKYQTKNTERNIKSKEDVQDLNSIEHFYNHRPPPPLSSLQIPRNDNHNINSQSNTLAYTDKFVVSQSKQYDGGFQQQPQLPPKLSFLPPQPSLGQRNSGRGAAAATSSSGVAESNGGSGNAMAGANAAGFVNAFSAANAGNANAGAFASAGAGPIGNPYLRRSFFFPFGKKR